MSQAPTDLQGNWNGEVQDLSRETHVRVIDGNRNCIHLLFGLI